MSNHTPGPWYVLDGRRVSWASPYREFGDGFSSYCVAITHEWPGLIDAEANARLIAAAPDMLQALRRAVLALAFAAETSAAMRDDYEAVNAAIAKATGGVA
jgi:hypothetical protein